MGSLNIDKIISSDDCDYDFPINRKPAKSWNDLYNRLGDSKWYHSMDVSRLNRQNCSQSAPMHSYRNLTNIFEAFQEELLNINNVPYRTVSHFGFNTPKYKRPYHYHLPLTPTKFRPLRRSRSLFDVFSTDRYLNISFSELREKHKNEHLKKIIPSNVNNETSESDLKSTTSIYQMSFFNKDDFSNNDDHSDEENDIFEEEEIMQPHNTCDDNISDTSDNMYYQKYDEELNEEAEYTSNKFITEVANKMSEIEMTLKTIIEEGETDVEKIIDTYNINSEILFIADIVNDIIEAVFDNIDSTFIEKITKMTYSSESPLHQEYCEHDNDPNFSVEFEGDNIDHNKIQEYCQEKFSTTADILKNLDIPSKFEYLKKECDGDYEKISTHIPYIDFDNDKSVDSMFYGGLNRNSSVRKSNEMEELANNAKHKVLEGKQHFFESLLDENDKIFNDIGETFLAKINFNNFECSTPNSGSEKDVNVTVSLSTPRSSKIPILKKLHGVPTPITKSDKLIASASQSKQIHVGGDKNLKKVTHNKIMKTPPRNFIKENINKVKSPFYLQTRNRINHGAIFSKSPFTPSKACYVSPRTANALRNNIPKTPSTPSDLVTSFQKRQSNGAVGLWVSLSSESTKPQNSNKIISNEESFREFYQRNPDKIQNQPLIIQQPTVSNTITPDNFLNEVNKFNQEIQNGLSICLNQIHNCLEKQDCFNINNCINSQESLPQSQESVSNSINQSQQSLNHSQHSLSSDNDNHINMSPDTFECQNCDNFDNQIPNLNIVTNSIARCNETANRCVENVDLLTVKQTNIQIEVNEIQLLQNEINSDRILNQEQINNDLAEQIILFEKIDIFSNSDEE